MIELAKFTRLLKVAEETTQCATIGLNVGGRQDPARWGAFGYLVLNSPTIGDALRNVVSHATIWQTGTHFAFRLTKDDIGVEYAITHPAVEDRAQDAEFSISYVKNIVDRLNELTTDELTDLHNEELNPLSLPDFHGGYIEEETAEAIPRRRALIRFYYLLPPP